MVFGQTIDINQNSPASEESPKGPDFHNEISLMPVNVWQALKEVIDICSPDLDQHSIELRLKIPKTFELITCPHFLMQILINLISNACSSVNGLFERWIEVAISESASGPVISISDSSDSNEGVSRSLTHEMGGSGMAVDVSRQIASALGGELYLNCQKSHTEFILRLPVSLH